MGHLAHALMNLLPHLVGMGPQPALQLLLFHQTLPATSSRSQDRHMYSSVEKGTSIFCRSSMSSELEMVRDRRISVFPSLSCFTFCFSSLPPAPLICRYFRSRMQQKQTFHRLHTRSHNCLSLNSYNKLLLHH